MSEHLLSLIIFTPLAAAIILLLLPARLNFSFKYITLAAVFIQLILALFIYGKFQQGENAPAGINNEQGFQLAEKLDWIDVDLGNLGKLSIDYFIAVDGLSISMVLLSAIVLLIGAIASWNIPKNQKGYFCLYLLLSTSIVGCFVALDFFLFYLFFEFMLLPMYFLIGMWGGPRREYASIKFFIFTLLGSIFILVVMIGLYVSVFDPGATAFQAGLINNPAEATPAVITQVQEMVQSGQIASQHLVHTFNMIAMTDTGNFVPGTVLSLSEGTFIWGHSARLLAFLALFIGFVIKLPAVPLHTWLPDAHVEAPTAISVVLAGILLKVGAYGIFRTAYSFFPEGAIQFAWWIGLLGLISIIYGAFNALAMKDLKKLIAYSSVSHMGFVLLGLASLTAEGVNGALYQMFSHGVLASMLFLIAGVIHSRTHNRLIANYRGLASRMPYFTAVVVIAFFASLGLPGFSGFIGELLVFLGAFNSASVNDLLPRWMAIVATLGLLLGAAYFLWTLQRMFFGKYWTLKIDWDPVLKDLTVREYIMFLPLILLTLLLGLYPKIFLDMVGQSVNHFVSVINENGMGNLEMILGQMR